MIGSRKQALTPSQCASIITAAEQVNFRKAQVRNTDGSSSYNEAHREGMVCFLRPDDLPAETWEAVQHAITSMNEQYYNAVIDTLDLQVAEYTGGQIGFEWHNDDPPYPSENLIWSGRKLTCVFELSDPTTYSGGYLEIQPYRMMRQTSNIFGRSQEIVGRTLQNLNASRLSIQDNKIEIIINDEVTRSISGTSISPEELTNDSRERGEATMFPSFFYHKVHPVVEGKRYSLTVWAKGPLWV